MSYFNVGHQKIFYKIIGDENKVPFVFIHGLGADRRQSISTLENLKGYRVICIDLPGHGDSRLPSENKTSFQYYCLVILTLLDRLSISTAHFGGISMGAGISMHLAIRYPYRVKGLVLVRPAWLDKSNPENLDFIGDIGGWMIGLNPEQVEEKLILSDFYQKLLNKNEMAAESIRGVLSRPQAYSAARILIEMVNDRPLRSIKQLNDLSIPSIVVGNDDDPIHPYFIAKEIASNIPGASLIRIASRYKNSKQHQKELAETIQYFLDAVADRVVFEPAEE